MIQDYIFAGGSVLFIIALLPALTAKDKPPRFTCALTAGVLSLFAVAQATLSLWFAAGTTAILALIWSLLTIQKRT